MHRYHQMSIRKSERWMLLGWGAVLLVLTGVVFVA